MPRDETNQLSLCLAPDVPNLEYYYHKMVLLYYTTTTLSIYMQLSIYISKYNI